jgi:hypothetical protein
MGEWGGDVVISSYEQISGICLHSETTRDHIAKNLQNKRIANGAKLVEKELSKDATVVWYSNMWLNMHMLQWLGENRCVKHV